MLVAFLSLSAAVSHPAAVPASVRPALKLRGGLAGIDAGTVATVGASLSLVNGAYCGIAPGPASEAYGLKDASFELTQMIKSVGYTFVAMAAFALMMLKGVPFATAFGWSNLPWVVLGLDNIWNGVAVKMGQPAGAPFLLLAINSVCMYCGLTDTYATKAAVGLAGWCALNGALFAAMPAKGLAAWGMAPEGKLNAMMKNFGYSLVSNAALVFLTATGMDIAPAFGYSFGVMLANILDQLYVSKGFEVLSSDKAPAYVWMIIQMAVIAGTLA